MTDALRDTLQATLGDAYTLDRELGGGGMSRVFVATETALGRRIVVKVLPAETGSAVSLERFKREIQVAARLQHPHIVPLLSAGESHGLPWFTMPFVQGESLRERLARGGERSVNETVHVLRDIAAALAYAHGEGVVHRDIKPENVMLSGGVAVVTDFGVAKAVDAASTPGGSATGALTSMGIALGTPAYMAPEQATADPHVDHRADIYAFGCVAYEMLAGASPFAGRPPQQLLAAHVTEAPEPLLKRRPTVPPALAALVMRCLEKRPGDRPQSGGELITALDAIATPSGGTAPTLERIPRAATRNRTGVALAAAALVIAGIAFVIRARGATVPPLRPGTTTPIANTSDLEGDPGISPDGRFVAYVVITPAGGRIFVRQVAGGRANLLTGDLDGNHGSPRWSPDGSRIAFTANGGIYVIPALGGTPRRVVDGGGMPTWSPDGRRLAYQNAAGLWSQPLDGGQAHRILTGASFHSPAWSPDGRLIAFAAGNIPTLTNLSTNSVWVVAADGGTPIRLSDSMHVNISPAWGPGGRSVLYVSNVGGARDVYQQAIDRDGRPIGAPVRLTTGLGAAGITIAADGSRLAYDVAHDYANIWVATIPAHGPVDFAAAKPLTRDNQRIEVLRLSHDGAWLAYDSDRGGNFDIYKIRTDGGDPVQLTTDPANDFSPSWSPDDKYIAFHSQRTGRRSIYLLNAEGSGDQLVARGPGDDYDPDWSPDGRRIAFRSAIDTTQGLYVTTRGADGRWSSPERIANEMNCGSPGGWSPSGTDLAFCLRGDVALVSADGGPTRVVATMQQLGGPTAAVAWGRDPRTVYASVARPDGFLRFWAIPVDGGAPRVILDEDAAHRLGRWNFTTDGTRVYFTLASWQADVWVMDLQR